MDILSDQDRSVGGINGTAGVAADLFRQSSDYLRAKNRRASALDRQIPISAGSTTVKEKNRWLD